MKTIKFPPLLALVSIGAFLSMALPATAQSEAEAEPVADPRPKESDEASARLIDNYLTVTGGKTAHHGIDNLIAEGTIKESTLLRNFKLVETNDGRRHLTYFWTHLGRQHRVVYVHDGVDTWTQVLEPKELPPQNYGGGTGLHFANLKWLIQPFTLPSKADYVFKYQGGAKVAGRPTHVVKAYGKKDVPAWFYFDKEQFLLLRWGSKGVIAGIEENMDYRATRFRSVDGVMLPSRIELLAENAAFGHIEFESILTNQDLSALSFFRPQSKIPTLRQRPTTAN